MEEKTTIATTSAHHVDASAAHNNAKADDRAARVREAFAADAAGDDNPLAAMLAIEAAKLLALAERVGGCLLAAIAQGANVEQVARLGELYAKMLRLAGHLIEQRQEILRRPT